MSGFIVTVNTWLRNENVLISLFFLWHFAILCLCLNRGSSQHFCMCLRWIPFIYGHIELLALLVSFLLLTTMATVNMCCVYVLPIRGRLMSWNSECDDDDFSSFTFGPELLRTSTMQEHRYKNTSKNSITQTLLDTL